MKRRQETGELSVISGRGRRAEEEVGQVGREKRKRLMIDD
jgi:hypothetical protein